MSDERVLENIKISQSGRFYHWRVDAFPIPRREIETHSANMHLIPANDFVEKAIGKIRQGGLTFHTVHKPIYHEYGAPR